jgi:release factor glutamine methyltransferase
VSATRPTRPTWESQRVAIGRRLAEVGVASADAEARWLTETASGYDAVDWLTIFELVPNERAQAHLDSMVERRVRGEPLQYVLGSWAFRELDLLVDERVLIPRPETEWVVEIALGEAVRLGLRRGGRPSLDARTDAVVADLGTGSGAIALALACALPDAEVWATDVSPDALVVARANLVGIGSAATRVRLEAGSWFDALPSDLRGRLKVVVSNPPYVAEHEVADLPADVAEWEPRLALVSGPSGLEAIEAIVLEAPAWLDPGGSVLVVELAPHQADAARETARAAGFDAVDVVRDLAGRDRVLVARVAGAGGEAGR